MINIDKMIFGCLVSLIVTGVYALCKFKDEAAFRAGHELMVQWKVVVDGSGKPNHVLGFKASG